MPTDKGESKNGFHTTGIKHLHKNGVDVKTTSNNLELKA